MAKANLAVVARSAAVSESPEVAERGRPRVAGKFFFRSGEKVFVRGVTYGPFATAANGARFPEHDQVARDFAGVRELGANCVRTFTPPPRWMLDLAAESGLWVCVGADWTWQACFLDSAEMTNTNRRMMRAAVRPFARHPAIPASSP